MVSFTVLLLLTFSRELKAQDARPPPTYVSNCSSPVGPPQLHLSDDDIHHLPATAPAHYKSPLYETDFTMAIKPITGVCAAIECFEKAGAGR